MRLRVIPLALAAVVILSLALPLVPAVAQQVQVQITSPEINEEIRGNVPIIGSASTAAFQYYKVEYGVGPSPSDWALIGDMIESPVINGQLAVWNTSLLPDGVYSLRLRAVRQDGNYDEFLLRGVIIANTRPTATPTETPTPTQTPSGGTPAATPQPGSPGGPVGPTGPTATVEVVTPSAPLAAPTPTPTVGRPIVSDELPFDTGGWGDSFLFGVLAMGAVFVVVGLVFGVRRLL